MKYTAFFDLLFGLFFVTDAWQTCLNREENTKVNIITSSALCLHLLTKFFLLTTPNSSAYDD